MILSISYPDGSSQLLSALYSFLYTIQLIIQQSSSKPSFLSTPETFHSLTDVIERTYLIETVFSVLTCIMKLSDSFSPINTSYIQGIVILSLSICLSILQLILPDVIQTQPPPALPLEEFFQTTIPLCSSLEVLLSHKCIIPDHTLFASQAHLLSAKLQTLHSERISELLLSTLLLLLSLADRPQFHDFFIQTNIVEAILPFIWFVFISFFKYSSLYLSLVLKVLE